MENQKGRRHSAKEAKEAIVLLKKKEGVDIARVEIYFSQGLRFWYWPMVEHLRFLAMMVK